MKAIKCKLVVNTRNGYCLTPVKCNSIREAVREAKEYCAFAYRIFDESGKQIRSGFCDV